MIDWAQRATEAQNQQGHVPSPCMSVCIMGQDSGLCTGCWRTLDEIAAWSTLSEAGKRSIWAQIARRAALQGDKP
ncbi:MAG: DUF1289 domain-containing protein [Hylemonella sp.]